MHGIEAQTMPSLLFYLMFAIGTDGYFIPNKNISFKCNPTEVILNCLSTIVDVLWIINSDGIPCNQMENFHQKLNTMSEKLQLLWTLKQSLSKTDETKE